MPRKKKSWTEKLHDAKDLPKVVPIGTKIQKRWGTTHRGPMRKQSIFGA